MLLPLSVMIALIAMAAKTYTTYPILLFCGREALSTIVKDVFVSEDSAAKERARRYGIATAWFVATLVFAIEVPDIGIVINLLGSLAAVFIFVFPGVCLWQTTLSQVGSFHVTQCEIINQSHYCRPRTRTWQARDHWAFFSSLHSSLSSELSSLAVFSLRYWLGEDGKYFCD